MWQRVRYAPARGGTAPFDFESTSQNSMYKPGPAIKKVKEATGDSPLSKCQGQVEDMVNVAYFGNGPHHDSDIDYQPPIPSHTEIYNYARECLRIVHGAYVVGCDVTDAGGGVRLGADRRRRCGGDGGWQNGIPIGSSPLFSEV